MQVSKRETQVLPAKNMKIELGNWILLIQKGEKR